MSKKIALRLISLIMLIIAIIFVAFALSHPEAGTSFYIGGISIGAEAWRAGYAIYIIAMISLFGASFWVKNSNSNQ